MRQFLERLGVDFRVVDQVSGEEVPWDGATSGELQVVLRREDVDGACLDGSARLGLDGFLCTRAGGRDRDDVCYLLD